MKGIQFTLTTVLTIMVLAVISASESSAISLDLNSLGHGEIVNNQFSSQGVTIKGVNTRNTAALGAVIFDSTEESTADPDLQGGGDTDSLWSAGGNIQNEALGNLLIIQENGKNSLDSDGFVINPDDQGGPEAGHFLFEFAYSITSFGFDLVDVENSEASGGFFAIFYDDEKNLTFQKTFEDLQKRDPTIVFGDNTANRVSALTADDLGFSSFNRVMIGMGGSGGITGIHFTPVPEPSTLLLLGSGIMGFFGMRRKT